VRHDVGGGEGDEGEGEKAAVVVRRRVGGDCVREESFPTNIARVGLCGH
jgi:hypothetical protein